MFSQIFHFIVDSICSFFCVALLARFTLQTARAPNHVWRNPLGQFIMAITDWMVFPTRRVIPPVHGYDSSTLLLAFGWQFLNMSVATVITIIGLAFTPSLFLGLILLAALETFKIWLYLVMAVVLISALFSWVNPHAPLADVFDNVSRPWLRPFQRLIPPVGGVDLSPLALIVLVQVALMLIAGARYPVLSLMIS